MWSLENEILHCGGDGLSASAEQELAKLGLMVKALDPTRPITYEADLDPDGVADVLGLHYPHEFPDFVDWPDTAYWMDQPITRTWMPGGQWIWDRQKPLYIGEYLWVPDSAAQVFTVLFGDPAYTDAPGYRNQAKELTWRMQTEAYRDYGVSAFCPWTMFEDPAASGTPLALNTNLNALYQAQAAAYHPNAVFVKEYDTRFFVASCPVDQSCSPDGREVVEGVWITPKDALAANLAGTMPLSPPAVVTMQELLRFDSEATLLADARTRVWGPALAPRLVTFRGGAMILEPWDPEHSSEEIKIDIVKLKDLVPPLGEPFSRLWSDGKVWRPVAVG